MPIVETRNLTKRYGRIPSKSVLAVDRVSLSVESGQVFGFLGPNGSGKTTTIGMLLGVTNPTAGAFSLLGASDPEGLVAARKRIGATLETPNFFPYMSGRHNLRVTAAIKGAPRSRIDECLELVGLLGHSKRRFRTYSFGMKQRLALASALLNDPELLILDEPANGLDPQGIRDFRQTLTRLADLGKTIFLSSHLLWEVEQACSHVAIVHRGKIVAQGSATEVLSESNTALVRANNAEALVAALEDYPEATSVRKTQEGILVALGKADLTDLNRYLAERDTFVSYLAPHRGSLEDVFIALTNEA